MRTIRLLRFGAIAAGLALVTILASRLLLTPVQGDVLILLSANQADRLAATTAEIHSRSGWASLGGLAARPVPAAPATASALTASISVGRYDALRLGGSSLPVQVTVQKGILTPILVAVASGRPIPEAVYAGAENVSLGLNELAGNLKAVPSFSLIDQFGRQFGNAATVGHDVLLAAFHTRCHSTCPLYTGLFLQLRKQLPASVLLIEATTNPQEDTPDVLREYAGRVGASWTFLTGDPQAMARFWEPFTVQLSNGQSHSSTLALIDAHGYMRTLFQGVPDVGGSLPPELMGLLNGTGRDQLTSRGNGWGQAQILDTLRTIDRLAAPSSGLAGQATAFALSSLTAQKVSLLDYAGQPLLINFWASYCLPCRIEMPAIEEMAVKHPKLVVLLVDERDDIGAARQFVADLHIRSTVLYDGNGKVGDSYGISGLPTTFFVRPDGSIEDRYVGQTNQQILAPHIIAIGA